MSDEFSQLELGQLNLQRGRFDAAFNIFYGLAKDQGNEEANYALTKMCFDGVLNPEQANTLFILQNSNSSLGNGYAHFNVGLMYERGIGEIQQDYKTAVEYYEKAIKEEVIDAYCNLGNLYVSGLGADHGIARNVDKGMDLLIKGAEEGSRQAAFTLGSIYTNGELVERNVKQGYYYLTLAAFAKHDQAKRALLIFEHAYRDNYSEEFAEAERQHWKIENMRRLYKCI
ncbi:sel1 repeat family protein [Polynucleobacter sp. AP-Jannik-300A-C4]|uniref:tetratricopeptide repeat protein n=1 Tax=Polynucleobacter sp. AP-Jannik-300A-C4 TaxID=2576928 RepID=UPI001BFDCB52|nr:tetratricopeptide repeat protein [Polynucleobacter sp. AP-Jannik-300A-C4]QWE22256.1 sel1 repeat family protein [Polynucleobacter sp. AP-Jannik-300A-C4]